MKNILLTGGAGYIGSHVAHLLLDQGHSVTIIDSLITGHKNLVPKNAKLIICDIADQAKVAQIIKNDSFDVVMHFAGLVSLDESIKQPERYKLFNLDKGKFFLKTCFEQGLKNVIFSSTAAVYGEVKKEKVCESDKLDPQNPYALSKLNLEKYLIESSKQFNTNFVILRYFNVAGADGNLRSGLISKVSTHLIKIACEVAVHKRKKLLINGCDYPTKDGTPVRDYIHVSDLAEIHLLAANYLINGGESNIFNCGYGKGFSVKTVVDEMNKIIDFKMNIEIGPRRLGDCAYLVADNSKFKTVFSWTPKFDSLNYILKTALNWEKKITQN